jgi:hypothetical protein
MLAGSYPTGFSGGRQVVSYFDYNGLLCASGHRSAKPSPVMIVEKKRNSSGPLIPSKTSGTTALSITMVWYRPEDDACALLIESLARRFGREPYGHRMPKLFGEDSMVPNHGKASLPYLWGFAGMEKRWLIGASDRFLDHCRTPMRHLIANVGPTDLLWWLRTTLSGMLGVVIWTEGEHFSLVCQRSFPK